MSELVVMVACAAMGSALTYVFWCVATLSGERTDTRCWWCGAKKRSYYERSEDARVVRLRRRGE
jgi:hypothetical protein